MPFPTHALTYSGGCNCRAVRYQVSIPDESERPANPYGTSAPPAKLPMTAICHCNDCRRTHGQAVGFAVVNVLEWVTFTFEGRAESVPAGELFDQNSGPVMSHPALANASLTFFKKTPQRARGFCRICGTPLLYFAFGAPEQLPAWWFPQLDIWAGTIDREDVNQDFFAPGRELWTDFGLDWAMKLIKDGTGESGPRAKRAMLEEQRADEQKGESLSTF